MSTLRTATAADAPFLEAMLAAAVDWRPGMRARPVSDVVAHGPFARYVEGWPRAGDHGIVAEIGVEGGEDADAGPAAVRLLGATWWRCFGPDHRGYGFVDATIPELTIGVVEGKRGRGIGGRLLDALVAAARAQGLPGLSLSVEPENPAVLLYERAGFRPAGGSGGAVTMLLDLAPTSGVPGGVPG